MHPKEHEWITARLFHALVRGFAKQGSVNVAYGSNNKWEGASGLRHQIDVSVEWPGERLILVESQSVQKRNRSQQLESQ